MSLQFAPRPYAERTPEPKASPSHNPEGVGATAAGANVSHDQPAAAAIRPAPKIEIDTIEAPTSGKTTVRHHPAAVQAAFGGRVQYPRIAARLRGFDDRGKLGNSGIIDQMPSRAGDTWREGYSAPRLSYSAVMNRRTRSGRDATSARFIPAALWLSTDRWLMPSS